MRNLYEGRSVRVLGVILGEGVGSQKLQAREILNNEMFAGTRNNQVFFESAQNPARGFFGQASHVGQVLMGQADADADAIGLLNTGSLCEVDENGGHPLFGPVQGKAFGIILGFAEAKA